MKNHRLCFPLFLLPLFSLFGCGEQDATRYIGIISAMDVEVDLLIDEANIKETKTIGSAVVHVGTLKGKDVIIARAGIGKINASSNFTGVMAQYDLSKVIFTGVAGGIKDEESVFDQVVGTKVVEHDYGYLGNDGFVWCGGDPGRFEPGECYECDPDLVELAYKSSLQALTDHKVFKGVIASGDQFIASADYVRYLETEFNAYACEMEGAAIAKVCQIYDKPFVIMRTLSDKADGEAHESYMDFMEVAAEQSNAIVLKMLESL